MNKITRLCSPCKNYLILPSTSNYFFLTDDYVPLEMLSTKIQYDQLLFELLTFESTDPSRQAMFTTQNKLFTTNPQSTYEALFPSNSTLAVTRNSRRHIGHQTKHLHAFLTALLTQISPLRRNYMPQDSTTFVSLADN